MKIIYYSPHPVLSIHSPAGYATHMKEMIYAFQSLGHTVLPLILGDSDEPALHTTSSTSGIGKKMVKKILPSIIWETLKDFNLQKFDSYAASKLEALIEAEQPDLVYERSNYLQVSGVSVCKRLGIAHVLEVNAPYVEERVVLGGASLLLKQAQKKEAIQLRTTNKVVVVSTALEIFFRQQYQLPAEKFLITPNAINPDAGGQLSEISLKKAPPGINEGDFVFGFVGSIFPWHGLDILIDSFSRLPESYANTRLLIVGDGEILPKLRQQAQEGGRGADIFFTGSIPHRQVFSYIHSMDCAIMAKSNWYGSPIKLFEYGVLGKPIIAPDTVPVKDVVKHLQTGYLVPPSADDMLAAMQWMYTNRDEARVMGERFRQQILEHHLWKHNAEAVLSSI